MRWVLILVFFSQLVLAKEEPKTPAPIKLQAQLLRPRLREERLFGLSWKRSHFKVDRVPGEKGFKPVVRLDGVFNRQRWNLISGVRWLVPDRGTAPDFSLAVELKGVQTEVEISAVGPDYTVETERFLIQFRDYPRFR